MEEDDGQPQRKRGNGQVITLVMGVLTVIATLVAAIPAFLQLGQDRASVYYEFQALSVLNPTSGDVERVKTILQQNNIPDSRAVLKIINTGDGVAKKVKAQVTLEGSIVEVSTDPNLESNPIWVDLPKQLNEFKGKNTATLEVGNLAPTKLLTISIGYNSSGNSTPNIQPQVFFDYRPAIQIENISAAPTNTAYQVLKIPLGILGVGVLLTLIVAAIIVIRRNEVLSSVLWRFFIEWLYEVTPFKY